jgi:class 3 adenylate cyclase
MQSAAPAGGIVISEDTRHLIEGHFELRELGPIRFRNTGGQHQAAQDRMRGRRMTAWT